MQRIISPSYACACLEMPDTRIVRMQFTPGGTMPDELLIVGRREVWFPRLPHSPVITMRWMIVRWFVAAAILTAQSPVLAQPDAGDPTSGRQLAIRLCSSCHRVLPMTLSDRADPPSFQSIADLPSTTGISLNVFLHSNHNNMPDFALSGAASNDLIAYILSLK